MIDMIDTIPGTILTRSRAWQIYPVVHQAHAGFVLPGNQTVGTFVVHRPFVLNLHTIGFVKTVFQVGDNAAKRLQRLSLAGDDQVTVNAALQEQQRLI